MNDQDIANDRAVEAEITRLVDAEVFDERGQDSEFTKIALRIMNQRWNDVMSWAEAFVDVPYASQWSDVEFLTLIRDGDDAELGRMIRQRTLAEFASDVFNAAETEWRS